MHQIERKASTGKIVVDALHQQRAAVSLDAVAEFVGRHPERAHDAVVERSVGLEGAQRARKSEAQVRHVVAVGGAGGTRHVDADQRRRHEVVRRLFE